MIEELIEFILNVDVDYETVEKLRMLVLDLAVRGKLVPQDPNDESVEELLARIAEAKATQIREGIVAQPKSFTSLDSVGRPFDIPSGWKWTQLGTECLVVMGNSPNSTTYNESGIGVPLINGPVEFSDEALGPTLLKKYTSSPTKMCQEGDLIVCVRASTGRTNIAAFDACIGRGVGLVRGYEVQNYVNLYMLWLGSALLAQGKGMIFTSLKYDDLASRPIPIPPLAEAKKIVNKVSELFSICDELEISITDRNNCFPDLIDSMINETLEDI